MSDLAAALMVAIRVHAKQVDKQGEPYLLHVLRVVEAVSPYAKVVAALHDVFEDGEWDDPQEALDVCAGLCRNEVDALDLLTKVDGTYVEYIERIAASGNGTAREVKLADLHDNLNRIPKKPRRHGVANAVWAKEWHSLKRRYEKAIATLEASS